MEGISVPSKPRLRSNWPKPALGGSASGHPEVLFTFDDGPSERTEKVLDTLKAHGVHAIFFLVGWRIMGRRSTPRMQAIVQRIIDERHAVGNHTVSHLDLCLRRNASRVSSEIDDAARAIGDMAHMSVVFFRAPFGVRCPVLEEALRARSLRNVHWDIDPQEWRSHDVSLTDSNIIHRIRNLHDDQRAVVLIHDTHRVTVEALPAILDFIEAENAKRRAAGRKEIRILSPGDIAIEWLAPGVAPALAATTTAALDFLPNLERRLLGPLPLIAKAEL